mmetsp:Transcript_16664/g.29957  ORF Transcript_16664/g.29957 Transcript_16664/m.29957 type:complete len:644 (+) Transcript_16664:3539-5470(+)
MALLQTTSDCLFGTSNYSAYDVLENLHFEEQELLAMLEDAGGTFASEVHERVYGLLRAWEANCECLQKEKVDLEGEVKALKKACDDAKHQDLRLRHSFAEKTAEWAELEKQLLSEIDALHKQEETLSADLDKHEKLYRQEAARSSKVLAEYHSRLLEVDQEIDELLHFHRQKHRPSQAKAFGDILPGLFDEVPISSRSSEKWEIREESEQSSYLPPEGLSDTQMEVFKRLSDLHKKVHKFRHCDLSQEVPESEHSLNQAFVESLPSDLKSLSASGGIRDVMKSLTRSAFNEGNHFNVDDSVSLATNAGLVFGSPSNGSAKASGLNTLQGLEFTDVRLEDILGAGTHEEIKTFEDESSIEQLPGHDHINDSCDIMGELDLGEQSDMKGTDLLSQLNQLNEEDQDQKPFDASGLSEIPLSFDSEHTNTPDKHVVVDSEQVTNRRGVPMLPLNKLNMKASKMQIFHFEESSGRAPPYRSPRREPELKLNISVSINNESSITLISECSSSIFIEERSRDRITLKHQRSKDEAILPPLNLSIESKGSSHKNSRSRMTPISMLNKNFPAKPTSAPRQGLKNFRGRSLLPAKQLSPLSIPTSPSYRLDGSRISPHDSSQGRSSSPSLFNRFRMRRYCEPKQPRLYIMSRH